MMPRVKEAMNINTTAFATNANLHVIVYIGSVIYIQIAAYW